MRAEAAATESETATSADPASEATAAAPSAEAIVPVVELG